MKRGKAYNKNKSKAKTRTEPTHGALMVYVRSERHPSVTITACKDLDYSYCHKMGHTFV